ncbi:MAG: hypothetical protein H6972_13515 [Gammaproteobacteria bacterium]|nr:hypothetical protein [Gammaproteobacteria bacterium]
MATLTDIQSAFQSATGVEPAHLAGGLMALCAGFGAWLVLAWVFQVGSEALSGSLHHAPRALLWVIAALLFFVSTLGVLYA